MPPKSSKTLSFEQSMERLENISAALENPETGLEETISLVEEGLKLVKNGRALLENAELRIKMLENPQHGPDSGYKNEVSRKDEDDFSLI